MNVQQELQRIIDHITTIIRQKQHAEGRVVELEALLERASVALAEKNLAVSALEEEVEALEARIQELEEQIDAGPPPVIVDPPPAPDPPIVGDEPARNPWFRALDKVGASVDELKGIASALEQRGSRMTERVTSRGYTDRAYEAEDYADIDFRPQWQWALNVALGGDGNQKTGNLDIERCSFAPGVKPAGATFDPQEKMKWGMRRYGLGDVYVGDCDFFDIPEEHGIYDSLSGHGYYRGNTFLRLGSQAIQMAYRDTAYQQYLADNPPLTKPPIIMVEDCHAVDCGERGTRPSYAYTFFDPGTQANPGVVILRDVTCIEKWATPRSYNGRRFYSTGGFVVHQYQHASKVNPATEAFVCTNSIFSMTAGDRPVGKLNGVEAIAFHDSVFAAWNHSQPFIEVDSDEMNASSGTIVIQNTACPPQAEVFLKIRGRQVCSMHQPGKRLEIDVDTLEVREVAPEDIPLTRLIHPLAHKVGTVPSGITPQPVGHVDDMPEEPMRFYSA